MKEEIVSKTGNMQLVHFPEDAILVIRIYGFLRANEFARERAVINETIRLKQIKDVIVNQSGMRVLSQEMQTFFIDTSGDFIKHGIKRMAIIQPDDLFARASLAKIIGKTKTETIEVMQFLSEPEAVQWLKS